MNLLIRTAPVQGYNKIFDIGEYRMRLTRFGLVKLAAGSSYAGNTGENELALVLIGGCFAASGEGWSFSVTDGRTSPEPSEENATVYRLSDDGRALRLSAAILRNGDGSFSFWSDANGDGEISDAEKRPCDLPPGALTYHGQKWLPGLSYLAIGQGTPDVWRLDPDRFDAHGNPVFTTWRKVLTDPVFAARRAGTATALDGVNELADDFSSDWMQADASPEGDLWIQARGGRNFSANFPTSVRRPPLIRKAA